jgi:hypothetical protein
MGSGAIRCPAGSWAEIQGWLRPAADRIPDSAGQSPYSS